MAQKTVHHRPGPVTLAQMTVQFGSRPSIFGWTVHFHPFGPSTLDLTRHTKSAVFGILYSFQVSFIFVSFFCLFAKMQSKMQKKLFQEVTSILRLRTLIVYYLKLSRDRRTPISTFLKRLSSRFNGRFLQKALWRSKGHRKSFILNHSDAC